MTKYWETETPVTVTTNKNVLQHYEEAGKLAVARLPWKDDDGKDRQGKTVTLDVAALLESDTEAVRQTRGIFADIVRQLDRRLGA